MRKGNLFGVMQLMDVLAWCSMTRCPVLLSMLEVVGLDGVQIYRKIHAVLVKGYSLPRPSYLSIVDVAGEAEDGAWLRAAGNS
ncbi:hypothetical protein Ancab_009575 [Ancistrocladus abbreviatus]